MTLLILAYLGGALTIFSPCILPVVPFVFARVDQPFVKSGLPLLAGMAVTFAGVASLGAFAGEWAVQANEYGRIAALVVLAILGITLLAPALATRLTQPVVALGSRLSNSSARPGGNAHPARASFGLGVATGLLWAPCAGPVLGLILTGAALQGPSVHTSTLLLSYAAGAATSLALVLYAGTRLLAAFRRSLGLGEWIRKGLGVAVLAGVAAVALGLDTGALAALSQNGTTTLEKKLIESRPFVRIQTAATQRPTLNLPVEGQMQPLTGAVEWLNSPPLTAEQLRGKVVLVDFWTFGCVNCRNAMLHVREWDRKYKDQGLVVVGVHAPEFAYEKNINNVKRAIDELDVRFPVAVDNNFAIWKAFGNNYWPAHYFIDAQGRIRFHHFGEGEYDKSEQVIQQLLEEAKKEAKPV